MNKSDLAHKKCAPCEGGTPPLTEAQIQEYLLELSGWTVVGNKQLEKKFKFKNFQEALEYVHKVGKLAEEEGHHPDICLHSYNKVKLVLSTHAIGGLSENDFILAAKIDIL